MNSILPYKVNPDFWLDTWEEYEYPDLAVWTSKEKNEA